MISITFLYGNQIIEVRVIDKEIYFAEVKGARAVFVPIDKLRVSVEGILKEFPELEGMSDEDIKFVGVKKFKEKIRVMKTEEDIAKYIINDLKQYGYIPKLYKKDGFIPIKL